MNGLVEFLDKAGFKPCKHPVYNKVPYFELPGRNTYLSIKKGLKDLHVTYLINWLKVEGCHVFLLEKTFTSFNQLDEGIREKCEELFDYLIQYYKRGLEELPSDFTM
jgi:hypothetical protein